MSLDPGYDKQVLPSGDLQSVRFVGDNEIAKPEFFRIALCGDESSMSPFGGCKK